MNDYHATVNFPRSLLAGLALSLTLAACGGTDNQAGEPASASSGSSQVQQDQQSAVSASARTKASGTLAEQAARAQWSPLVQIPIVPISAANLPDGRLLLWSAEDRFNFSYDVGRTYTVLHDPITGQSTERLLTETGHDMFCPGTTNLPDGRILVNGGLSAAKTSIFDYSTNNWSTAAAMNIPRGYPGNTLLADGSVLTLGGSWSGGVGNKHGEIWTEANGWRQMAGIPVDRMLSTDRSTDFSLDSHMWLIPTGNGQVLHAGPTAQMNWINTRGQGQVKPAGSRGDDVFSISGNAVMFDTGKILKVGGVASYQGTASNSNSFIIEANNGVASARRIGSMAYPRTFHNSVVLPNGQVIVLGGQTLPIVFSDSNSVLVPELFDPATETFTALPPISVGRNYHSIGLLMPDGRVLSGGGGLCGDTCPANHPDIQFLSPPYLFNGDGSPATRPVITNAPRTAAYGTSINVQSDSPIDSFAIVRLSSATHSVNNDQRRLSLVFRNTGANNYSVDIPSNPGWALPGEYMLFAMNADGTPSISRTLRIAARDGLWLTPPDDLFGTVGANLDFQMQASANGGGTLSYGATGLPDGLFVNTGTGRISGTPTRTGTFVVNLTASNGNQTVSWQVPWSIGDLGNVRYVRFEALSEVNGNAWASMAEFDLFDDQGRIIARNGWNATASSAEMAAENGSAANVLDGNPATHWQTQWQGGAPAHPHQLIINLGGAVRVGGFRYTPRVDTTSGTVANYRFYLSGDGVNWGGPVASGDLRELGGNTQAKTVFLGNLAQGRAAIQSSTALGGTALASRAVDGNTDGLMANASTSATDNEANAWWEVDLGSNNLLHTLRLWNRTDCCAEQLNGLHVLLSAAPMAGRSLPTLLADAAVQKATINNGGGRVINLGSPGTGRYLRIQLAGTGTLNLAEVQAFGFATENRAPSIATPNPPAARVGVNLSLQLSASDPDGDTLSWAANGLPPGLALNTASGLISGQPLTPGNFNVQITLSDGRGGNASAAFAWTVQGQPVTIAPIAAPVMLNNAAASYTASASGNGLQYRWNFGDGTAETAYSPTATTSHVYTTAGVYTVTLSVRDTAGAVSTRNFVQAVVASLATGRSISSSNLAYQARSGGARLWVANPDNNSVSVFDTASNARLAEIAVGAQPIALAMAANGRIWVSNRDDATLSVIDSNSLSVVQTISLATGSQPHGLVIANDGNALVALEGTGRLLKVAPAGTVVSGVSVDGARHLALSADGTRLLVSRYISAAQPGEATLSVQSTVNGSLAGGEVIEFDPATLAQRRRIVLRHSDRNDSTIGARGVPNYLGAAAISPDGRSAWIPSKQDNIYRGQRRDGRNLDFETTIRAISSRIDLNTGVEDYPARIDHDNAGVASAAAYHPNGAYVFVSLETSRQVAVIDAAGRRELFRFDSGRAPQGLGFSADGRRLYVNNFTDRTVAMFDLSSLVDYGNLQAVPLGLLASVSIERLAANILAGKQLFYDARDPRLARDNYLSCASCHNDGTHDGRTWDLSGFGEGLRNTASLKGRGASGHGALHWSANFDEVQDFEGQIRTLAAGKGLMTDAQFQSGTRRDPLGERKAGISTDLDALAAYVNSLVTQAPSPYRNADRSLSAAATTGKSLFNTLSCAGCHSGAQFAGGANAAPLRNIGTIKPSSGQRLGGALSGIDTPTLRDVWATAPYLHDGSAVTIADAIRAHNGIELKGNDAENLAAYVREIGSEEPAAANGAAVSSFAISGPSSPITLSDGSSAELPINVAFGSQAGASVTFSCAGLPANAQCLFDPAVVQRVAGASIITKLTLRTGVSDPLAALGAGAMGSAGLALLALGAIRVTGTRRRSRASLSHWAIVLLICSSTLAGCGGGGGGGGTAKSSATPPGTYTIAVNATDGVSTQTVNVTLVVR
jgi:large repetitive protein